MTAKMLGLTIPKATLAPADEVGRRTWLPSALGLLAAPLVVEPAAGERPADRGHVRGLAHWRSAAEPA